MRPSRASPRSRAALSQAMTDGGRTVGGVVLAAGRSRRFGEPNKLLATVDGQPIVRRAARSLLDAPLADVTVVLGYQAAAVRNALDGLDVSIRVNDAFEDGQSTSVAEGVRAARANGWDAAVFGLGDMPFVDPGTIDALLRAYAGGAGTVLAPAYEGVRGNPVLFDCQHFDGLADVDGDLGGRDIVETAGTLVPVDDPGVRKDVDRPSDLGSNS